MSDLRIVVVLTDANPELIAEFEKISPRARAERMRVLATLGQRLVGYSGPAQAKIDQQNIVDRTPVKAAAPVRAAKAIGPTVEPVEGAVARIEKVSAQRDEPSLVPERGANAANKLMADSRVARFARSLGNSH